MSFRDELLALGGRAEASVIEVYRRFLDATITRDQAVELLAVLVQKYNLRAATLADLSLSATLMVETATPVPVTATTRATELDRLSKAASTVLVVAETSEVPEAIVARLARAETFNAGQNAYTEGIATSKATRGWIRGISPNCCQLCRWWWREGRVWPKDHPMPTHKGCTCSPIPVVREGITSTGHTRRLARDAATEGTAA